MSELVHENLAGAFVVDSDGALQVEDAAAAIFGIVHKNLDHVVGRGSGRVPQRAVVVGQHVALEIEDVVLRRQRGMAIDAISRMGDARFRRRDVETAYIEIGLAAPERFVREEVVDKPRRVGMKLRHLPRRVAFADQ